jgi:MFS family permease
MGLVMDNFGRRSKFLVVACGLASIVFLVLGISNSRSTVWIGTVLFAVNNSLSDLAIVMVPIIVGPSRAGVAYGLYGILGNSFDALTRFLSGVILESGDNGVVIYVWFPSAITFMGVLAWTGVYVLESRMSSIETPLDQIIETRMEYFHFATLCGIATESPELEEDRSSGNVDEVSEEMHV